MPYENHEVKDIITFMIFVLCLKKIKRSGWIKKVNIDKPESVADHCYSMCMLGILLSQNLNMSIEKIVKMILLHDLAESVIGDVVANNNIQTEKHRRETNAMVAILSYLPSSLHKDFHLLWQEYMENKSELSKFIHCLDKLEMALQARMYATDGFSPLLLEEFIQSAKKYLLSNGPENRLISDLLQTSLNSIYTINSDMQYFMALKLGEKRVNYAKEILTKYTGLAMPALALKDNNSNNWEPVGEEINYAVAKEDNGYIIAICDNHGIAKSVAQWFMEDEKNRIIKQMVNDGISEYLGKLYLPI